ncbi:ABC transporter substrate-binding protein [Noviherbaspirillum sp. UKPF54]|uniref:ABC transporter substrate-binding protein n=1 Tax=Noviherbaspirillum sp. UKPF54 TaxID=2601898 RepID=UPI0011B128CC|nr:ABC transporter substrate-binding protein [Noviherbaspirillum sp. UKPF54]QDZ28670.1 extracellular solute-binding protein [Noviherbaspirillum sp. UKPF54]
MKNALKPILLAAAMAAGFAHAGEMTVVNFGGANGLAQKAAYVEPFQKASGNKVTVVEYNGEMAKLKAMVETKKVSWDLVEIESGEIGRACDEGLLEKIDISKIGKKEDFMPAAIHECGLGAFVWSTVLGYNADKLKTPPTSWADFWDVKKFPGKRGLRKGARFNMEFALMADGVAPKEVYNVLSTKAGVDRAFKKLDELKGNIQWWEAGAQPPQFLVAGDVVMSSVYNGRIDAAQREGKNLAISWNGSVYDLDYWVIPKGAKNKDVAEKFIAYSSTPEAQHVYATKIAYGPVNNYAFKRMDYKLLSQLPTSSTNAKTAVQANLKFWADHGEELEQRFAAWAAK